MPSVVYVDKEPIYDPDKEETGSIQDDFAFRNNVADADLKIRMGEYSTCLI